MTTTCIDIDVAFESSCCQPPSEVVVSHVNTPAGVPVFPDFKLPKLTPTLYKTTGQDTICQVVDSVCSVSIYTKPLAGLTTRWKHKQQTPSS